MAVFDFGSALPLLGHRHAFARSGPETARQAHAGRPRPPARHAAVLILLGGAIFTGYDKLAEAWLVNISPEWLTKLTTSI